ncbi:MAG TPA: amylo-alpha-1,6-glucosidase [Spirochaetota bacterium]|nr:amylo-alpha-1,6-glucosidase [Spirochaetota bacterium]
MYRNKNLTIETSDKKKRFVVTDNYYTYFTVSDFNDRFDGLWSGGFHLFDAFYLSSPNNKIKYKSQNLLGIEIDFENKTSLKFLLLKKSEGLIINFLNKNFLSRKIKRYNLSIKINTNFNLLESNKNYLIIEYDKPERLGFGFDKFYCAFVSTQNFIFEKIQKNDKMVNFDFYNSQKVEKESEMLVLYESSLNKLKKQIEYSKTKTNNLKKQHLRNSFIPFAYSSFETEDKNFDKALTWATYSANGFVMQKSDNIGLWAGLQWFDNSWGRDTFISLPGVSLVSGRYEEAKHIIENFIRYQCNNKKSDCFGKIPNVIFSEDKIIFNTADATPLLVREIYEYFLNTGDYNFILSIWHTIKLIINSQYLAKKDKNFFVVHKDADDWMDAKKNDKYSFSPRSDKAIEIEALWYTALCAAFNIGREIINYGEKNKMPLPDNIKIEGLKREIKKYRNFAEKLKKTFNSFFVSDNPPYIFDHVNEDYSPDNKIRPNPLIAIYYSTMNGIPSLFDRNAIIKFLKYVLPKIIYLHGVSSLDKNDPDFYPINDSPLFHKDEAYHNGMIWTYLSGFFINVCASFGLQDFCFLQTRSLMNQILNNGALGSLSELVYPYKKNKNEIIASGTYSQTWSLAEFCRSFYRDYLGVSLNVPKRKIYFSPSIPVALGFIKANVRYGFYETMSFFVSVDKESDSISKVEVKAVEILKPLYLIIKIKLGYEKNEDGYKYKTLFVKVKFSANRDSCEIEFIKNKENTIKIKNLKLTGNCEVISMEIGYEISKDLYHSDLKYSISVNDEELKEFERLKREKKEN